MFNQSQTLYDVLGVNSGSSQAEIRSAYLRLAKRWHPDLNKDDPEQAASRFKEISAAYRILSDPKARAEYDQNLAQGASSDFDQSDEGDFDPNQFFEAIFEIAFEMAAGGFAKQSIFDMIIRLGCPEALAKPIAEKAWLSANQSASNNTERGRNFSTGSAAPREQGATFSQAKTENVQETKTAEDPVFEAGPWSRLFARSLDLLVAVMVASPALAMLLTWTTEEMPNVREGFFLFLLLAAPVPFLVDAVIVGIFGNSLGKSLLRIQVLTRQNKSDAIGSAPLQFGHALTRNTKIYITGYWFGLPFLCWIPQFLTYRRLSNGQKAWWDIDASSDSEKDHFPKYEVVRSKAGIGGIFLFLLVLAFVGPITKLGYQLGYTIAPPLKLQAFFASTTLRAQNPSKPIHSGQQTEQYPSSQVKPEINSEAAIASLQELKPLDLGSDPAVPSEKGIKESQQDVPSDLRDRSIGDYQLDDRLVFSGLDEDSDAAETSRGGCQTKVQPARALREFNVARAYPQGAFDQGFNGQVSFIVSVAASGIVSNVKIVSEEPEQYFHKAVKREALRMVFEPALLNCQPVASNFPMEVTFDWNRQRRLIEGPDRFTSLEPQK